jgi:serine/threonine protein kinase
MSIQAIGGYEVLYALKSGGMGDVLLARRRGPGGFDRLVAIKTIRAELASTPAVRAMFLDEAALLSRLSHPAVAAVHDFGEEAGMLYLVMEYVAGIPFRDLIERRVPPIIAAAAVIEAGRGVHAAHELRDLAGQLMGVVHRDISPDNLMLGFDGHVKVIDFGIALIKGRQAPVTEFGMVKGKPPYMSPEQVKNDPLDRRSDVFSLSVVLHELLTGQALFDGDSIYAVARAVEHAIIPSPSSIVGGLPFGLDAAVNHGLARELDRRTPSAAALADELQQVVLSAGGETLEAWAEQQLREDREHHRQWLGQVLGGQKPERRGRGTGELTAPMELVPPAVGPPSTSPHGLASSALAMAATSASPLVAQPGASSLELLDAPVRSRRWALTLLVSTAVAVGAFVGMRAVSQPTSRLAARANDAATLAGVVLDGGAPLVVLDVSSPDAAEVVADAAVRGGVDAGRRDSRHRPELEVPGAAARLPDAAVAMRSDGRDAGIVGFGHLTITASPYALIRLDGHDLGSTPVFRRKVPAGSHEIVLTSPESGVVRHRRTFDLPVGGAIKIEL